MTPARWKQINDLFFLALESPPAQRDAFLVKACGNDADLRLFVEELLANDAHEEKGPVGATKHPHAAAADDPAATALPSLTENAASADATRPAPPVLTDMLRAAAIAAHDFSVGDGSHDIPRGYRVLEKIGEGGFGAVFLAEQTEPVRRRVALKIIKPGMDSKAVIARFEAERQALALMDHPNIARIFDAGTTATGRPYFVMEHVPGIAITEHCDRQRLNIRQRLELFAVVAEAVAHAHTKGIIHRDLKPSNILVSIRDAGQGIPKIIDFGVAKATHQRLTEHSIFTEQGVLIGTPEYMSPEQAEMTAQDIDTRSDVYSLGVVLYEMLTGALPFDSRALRSAGLAEICRIIRSVDPPKPSTKISALGERSARVAEARRARLDELLRTLRSELEWIPLKALRKDRSERYRSALDLADDIRNYLHHRPLIAGPESPFYRARKFVRRNKAAVSAGGAVLFALILGLTGTLWQADLARREAAAARAARDNEARARARADESASAANAARAAAERARASAELEAYIADLAAADAALVANEPARARVRLDACPPRLRGWEWGYYDARSDTSVATLAGHGDVVNTVSYSPTGDRIVTASHDGTARVWNAASGQTLAILRGHEKKVVSAAFSPAGDRVVTASFDGTARVWNAASGAQLAVLRGHEASVRSAWFNSAGDQIVTASTDSTAAIWSASSGARLHVLCGHEQVVQSAMFSPTGDRVVTASDDKTVRVWDAASGAELYTFRGHDGNVSSAAFSPAGNRIVSASSDRTARVWDASGVGEPLVLRGHESFVRSAAFSPAGDRIATTSRDVARIWDTATGAEVAVLRGHASAVCNAVFSPAGDEIVTTSDDATIRVWDAANGRELAPPLRGHADRVISAAFSPSGDLVASASADKTVRIWDRAAAQALIVRSGEAPPINFAAFSPGGDCVVTASQDHTARLWDSATGIALAVLRGHHNGVQSATFNTVGDRIVTASKDRTAIVWDASGQVLAVLAGHDGALNTAAFSPAGDRVVTASADNTARVWNAVTGEQMLVLQGHAAAVQSAGYSPDGDRIVTAAGDNIVRIWNAVSGNVLITLPGHEDTVFTAVFSPAGDRLVTASKDKTARLWDATNGTELTKLLGHENAVLHASFNSAGDRVITASSDKTIRVWDAGSGLELAVLHGHEQGVNSAMFSRDGERIVSAAQDRTVRLWDAVRVRDRNPYVRAFRQARARLEADLLRRIAAGETTAAARSEYAALSAGNPAERNAALATVHAYEEQLYAAAVRHADALNSAAWKVVRVAPPAESGTGALLTALEDATRAVALAPNDADMINTLGMAQYRLGRFDEALATLLRAEQKHLLRGEGPRPAESAFLAMTHWQLGHADDARKALRQFRELAALQRWKSYEETQFWLTETSTLIPDAPP